MDEKNKKELSTTKIRLINLLMNTEFKIHYLFHVVCNMGLIKDLYNIT